MSAYSHLRDSFRYQSSVLIANWMEERELRRTRLKDMLNKQATGTLKLDAYHTRMSVALQEVDLIKAVDDEHVHFGDVIQLVHLETSSVVACDVGDADIRPGELSCAATAAPQVTAPCARNTLVLVKYQPPANSKTEPDYGDDTLRYGQKVRLAAHPSATGQELDAAGSSKPLCLFSKPMSTTHCAKYCRNQLVGFTYRNSYDTVWEVVTPDPAQRALSTGLEVLAGAPVLLIHSATQKPLKTDPSMKYPNDFGLELELTAKVSGSQGLKLSNEQCTIGLLKGSLTKSEGSDTFWTFMTGTKVGRLPPAQPKLSQESNSTLAAVVSDLQATHGSIYPLEKKLITWSTQQALLPSEELLLLLRQVGLHTPDSHAAALAAAFEPQGRAGMVDVTALLAALRTAAGGTGSPLRR